MDGIRILCMLCGLFGKSMAALVVYIISIMAVQSLAFSTPTFFIKKKLATGEGLKIQYNTKSVIYLIIAISAIVFIIWTLFWGSIQIRCNDRDFNIEAKGWNDYTGSIRKLIAFLMKKMYCRTIMITELMVLET